RGQPAGTSRPLRSAWVRALQHRASNLISLKSLETPVRTSWRRSPNSRSNRRNHKEISMKYRVIAIVLALAVTSWAQANSSSPDQKPAEAKAVCSCCAKTDTANQSDPKQAKQSCMKKTEDGKEVMACCDGKDAKACSGETCCKDG